jgi:hypothetical protein
VRSLYDRGLYDRGLYDRGLYDRGLYDRGGRRTLRWNGHRRLVHEV